MATSDSTGSPPRMTTAEEQSVHRLVDAITDYAIYMLDPDGVVSSWNRGAQRFKGYEAAEILGQNFSRFYTPEDRQTELPRRALDIAAREGRFEAEGWRVRKDNSRFWAHVVIDPIRDETGRLLGFAKITRDVTERREGRLALEQARAALAQAQKLDALGQLTGGVAHDFNNLLQAMSGCLAMIGRRTAEPAVLPLLKAGQQAVDRGARLVRELMTFSRRGDVRLEPIDVRNQVLKMRALLEQSLRADIELHVDLAPDLWTVEADPVQFEMALINLAANARDAMPSGGTLSLTAANAQLPEGNAHGLQGDFVRIEVADSGSGISPEIVERVFEPFFTTKEVGKGSGLGLPQVYGMTRQSGGTARVDSAPGLGTTVTLLLQRAACAAPAPEEVRPAQVPTRRGGRLLMVEDDPVVSTVIAGALEDAGWEVVLCVKADDALPLLAGAAPIDLLFTDVVMPGKLNGLHLAREAKRLRPGLPVLLTTGYSEDVARAEGVLVLAKPYRIEYLISAIDAALAG